MQLKQLSWLETLAKVSCSTVTHYFEIERFLYELDDIQATFPCEFVIHHLTNQFSKLLWL